MAQPWSTSDVFAALESRGVSTTGARATVDPWNALHDISMAILGRRNRAFLRGDEAGVRRADDEDAALHTAWLSLWLDVRPG